MRDAALQKAIDTVGGVARLAEAFDPPVTSQAISQWSRAPADRVLTIERATGGAVTRHELRPDIYPSDDEAQRAGEAA